MLRTRKRRKIVAPRKRRRWHVDEDEERDAETLALGPGDKSTGEGGC